MTQSWSVAGFTSFIIEKREDDDLPQHIKGAACWPEVLDEEGYFVFDTLSQSYLPVEYEPDTRQWYFICQDTQTQNWIATQPVPSTFNLGRQSIKQLTVQAADIDNTEGQSNHPSDHQHNSMATTMQTSTAAAALTLAGTQAPTSTPINWGFGGKPSLKGKGTGPPDGGGGSSGPLGGGLPGGGFPGGGPQAGAPGGGAPGTGGDAKLGGNPPPEFNGDHSQASTFMNQFNLYRLANMEASQMRIPMKRTVLLLGFIKGPNMDAWVKLCTDEILRQFNWTMDQHDEIYWDEVGREFMNTFWDTASRERTEEKLCNLTWTPGDVDTFVAQFRTLADEAEYPLDDRPTISLFASKLPHKMMEHICLVIKPRNFQGWADTARQYHQDNTAVQNLRNLNSDVPRKLGNKKTGFSAKQWAQILGVKLPIPDSNTMDTCTDRTRSYYRNKGSKGHTGTTKEDPVKQHQEGRCFTCNKQGHLAKNCPDKPWKDKGKVKARTAKTNDGDNDTVMTPEEEVKALIQQGRLMEEETNIRLLQMAIEVDKGAKGEDMDF